MGIQPGKQSIKKSRRPAFVQVCGIFLKSVEVDSVGVLLFDFAALREGDVFAVLEHVVDHVVAVMFAPAAQGGVGSGVHMAVGEGFLQRVYDLAVDGVFIRPVVTVE